MSERYSRLFTLPENLYAVGSPVVIAAGALLKDNQTGRVLAQLKLRNIRQKEIKAVTISLIPLDTLGKPLGEAISHQYLDLTVRRNQDFGQKIPIPMPDATTRSFVVTVEEVVFSDLTTWISARNTWDKLQEPRYLSSLYDRELVQQFRMEYGTNCVNQLLEEKDLWHCVCGALNRKEESVCHICGKSLASLQAIDMEAMRQRKDERITREREEAEEAAKLQAEKTKSLRKKALIVGAATILLVAVAMMIRPAIIRAMDYKNAVALLNQGNYEEAISAFTQMGDYKDSPTKMDEATYQKAMSLYRKKEYEDAIATFRTIPDFEDSKQQIENINNAILEEKYVNACSLLKEGSDQEAYDAFWELGDYKDSVDYLQNFVSRCTKIKISGWNGQELSYNYDESGNVVEYQRKISSLGAKYTYTRENTEQYGNWFIEYWNVHYDDNTKNSDWVEISVSYLSPYSAEEWVNPIVREFISWDDDAVKNIEYVNNQLNIATVKNSKKVYIFYENGNYNYEHAGKPITKHEYRISDAGKVQEEINTNITYYAKDEPKTDTEKYVYKYNSHGDFASFEYTFDSTSRWEHPKNETYSYEMNYDQDGRLISRSREAYDRQYEYGMVYAPNA